MTENQYELADALYEDLVGKYEDATIETCIIALARTIITNDPEGSLAEIIMVAESIKPEDVYPTGDQ